MIREPRTTGASPVGAEPRKGRSKAPAVLAVALLLVIIAAALFFWLFDVDVTSRGDLDVDVPSVDADVDAPDIDVEGGDIELPEVDVDPQNEVEPTEG